MNKNQWMKIVNPLLGAAFVVLAVTGVILFFNLFSSQGESISKLHEYTGLTFVALGFVHLLLNWGWVNANLFNRK